MTIQEIKHHLQTAKTIAFELPNGELVPNHFHVTEIGKIEKNFIDCGGTIRKEVVANFQLWNANDYDHRLHPEKLINIIELAQDKLDFGDLTIEVEYQGGTIGKFGLDFKNGNFLLTNKNTACLALEECGTPNNTSDRIVQKEEEASCSGTSCC